MGLGWAKDGFRTGLGWAWDGFGMGLGRLGLTCGTQSQCPPPDPPCPPHSSASAPCGSTAGKERGREGRGGEGGGTGTEGKSGDGDGLVSASDDCRMGIIALGCCGWVMQHTHVCQR